MSARVFELNTTQKYVEVNVCPENSRGVCLTLDLEQDYGDLLDKPSYDGLSYIPTLVSCLKRRHVPLTIFVQGSLLENFPDAIERLCKLDVEFELHSYSHLKYKNTNTQYEVELGKKAYIKFFGKNPKGYRFPSGIFNHEDYAILAKNGFQYDSSIFPSIRPGAFNNLNMPIKPYYLVEHKIVELPFTVFSRFVRIPIALSYIKLLGWPYLDLLKLSPLPNVIIFNFHMHDLFTLPMASDLKNEKSSLINKNIYKRIYQQKRNDGFVLLERVMSMFQARKYEFIKLDAICDSVIKEINKQ